LPKWFLQNFPELRGGIVLDSWRFVQFGFCCSIQFYATINSEKTARYGGVAMKSNDKFLIGIVAGIVLLIIVAFGVVLSRPKPEYRAEDTPEGVVHNYLLALQQEEYARAYSYLSPTLLGYPRSVESFAENVRRNSWQFSRNRETDNLNVESSRLLGAGAEVTVRRMTFSGGGLFNSGQQITTFKVTLSKYKGAWKITDSEKYWLRCWENRGGCN
jgi:hypothetical protein